MFIMTAKINKQKIITIALIALVAVVLLALLVTNADTPIGLKIPSEDNIDITSNDGRIAYLATYGWEVKTDPNHTQQVRIPTNPSEVFERYNDLQISQGFDLHEYAGKIATRYVYEITNYPNSNEPHYVTLFIYEDTVIGGDVCSASKDGVMHGLALPQKN